MNEALRSFSARFAAIWGKYSATQKRNIVIIGAAAILCLIVISFVFLRPNYVTIMSGLDDKSLGQVQSKLADLKIPNEIQGSSVLVPQSQADTARVQVAMAGLPESGYIGYSSIPNTMGMTQDQFNVQVLDVLQQSLGQTIQSVNGIESAQVHIVMPQQQLFISQPQESAKASVFVQLGNGVQLSPEQVAGIQQLVAHSVKDLSASDVTVVDQNGVNLQSTPDGSSQSMPGTSELTIRQQLEQSLSNQLTQGLDQIVGPGNAVIMVHANISFNQIETKSHTVAPVPGTTTGLLTSSQNIRRTTTSNNGPGGAGGMAGSASSNPGLPTYAGAGTSGAGNSTSSDSESTSNYDNSYTDATVVHDPIQLTGYTVGVFLNSSNKGLTPAVMSQIKSFVENAVGAKTGAGAANAITVSSVPFQNQLVMTQGSIPTKWIVAGGSLLLLVLLGALWLAARRKKRDIAAIPEEALSGAAVVNEELVQNAQTEDERLRDQLVKLANQKPDEFTNLLRTWLAGD